MYNLCAKVIAAMVLIFSCACVVRAENEDVDSVRTGRVLPQTQVSARGVSHEVSTPLPTQRITGETIANLGITNVGQALMRMAGTQVRDYGGVGGMKTVSVHSLGAAHTGVAYDGVPVSNCQAGQVDVGRFFVDNLNEINLTVGHDDDMMQSASSMASAAMLRLTTAMPHFANDNARTAMTAIVKTGSWGEFAPTLMLAHRLSGGDVVGLNATYQRADGHYSYVLPNGEQDLHERRANTDISCGNAEANWLHQWARGRMETKVYGFYSERGLPGPAIYYNNVSHQRLRDGNAFAQTVLTQTLAEKLTLQARAKYNYSYNRFSDSGVRYPNGHFADTYHQHEGYLSGTLMWQPIRAVALSIAQDVRLNTLSMEMGISHYCNSPRRLTSLTAMQARYALPRVSVNASLLMTLTDEHVTRGRAMKGQSHLSPSLAVSVRPFAAQRLYVRAMYKNTFRMPSFNDLYYDKLGNAALQPERAHEYSLGMTWEKNTQSSWWPELSLTADAYIHRVTDKIVAMPGVYVWKMVNYGRVHIGGADVTMHSRWRPMDGCTLAMDAAYTWQRAVDRTKATAPNYGHQLPYTPRHSGSVSVQAATPWIGLGWSVQMMGERYALAANIEANRMKPYTMHDINVWRDVTLGATAVRVQLSACNVTDCRYDIIRYYPMPGRHYRATVTVKI